MREKEGEKSHEEKASKSRERGAAEEPRREAPSVASRLPSHAHTCVSGAATPPPRVSLALERARVRASVGRLWQTPETRTGRPLAPLASLGRVRTNASFQVEFASTQRAHFFVGTSAASDWKAPAGADLS